MAEVIPNFRGNVGDCGCGVDSCSEYGTFRKKLSRNGKFCCKTCTACADCRGGGNRLGWLKHQKRESKNLQVAQKNSLGYGNEESAGIDLEWEHKSGGRGNVCLHGLEQARQAVTSTSSYCQSSTARDAHVLPRRRAVQLAGVPERPGTRRHLFTSEGIGADQMSYKNPNVEEKVGMLLIGGAAAVIVAVGAVVKWLT